MVSKYIPHKEKKYENEIKDFQNMLEKGAHVIYRFARQGGFGHAANF